MPSKHAVLVMLVGINLLLAAVLIFTSTPPPAAYAQAGGRPGEFVSVTAQVSGQSFDSLFLLDLRARKLHAFVPRIGNRKLQYGGYRDLAQDFGR